MFRLLVNSPDTRIRIAEAHLSGKVLAVILDELGKNLLLVLEMESNWLKTLRENFQLMLARPGCALFQLLRFSRVRVSPLNELNRHGEIDLQQTTELNGEYPVLIWYLDVYSPFFPIEVVALPDVVVFSLRVQPKISPGNGVPQKSDENGNGAFLANDLNVRFEQFIQSVSDCGSAKS